MSAIISSIWLRCVSPQNTLFFADAGFVGYELWKAIIDQGHHFLIRVGANVRLLKGLGVAMKWEQGIVAQALKIIREIMSDWHEPVLNSEDDPVLRLQGATKDNYQRSSKKTARYHWNYKDKPGATKPVIQQASSAQRTAFQQLQQVI